MLDLRKPHLWYPVARSLQRRLVYHVGPTNSGKTYNALQAMRAARSGVYCGPLRLLAMEIYDELNAAGTYCNLITGALEQTEYLQIAQRALLISCAELTPAHRCFGGPTNMPHAKF